MAYMFRTRRTKCAFKILATPSEKQVGVDIVTPGIDPYRYLTWLFQRLPLASTADDYDGLLPWKMPVNLR
ncbi:hypothetical protein WL16_26140 [Burkholderia ubonensis]|nr:hypothetical protein WL16_26140 [Burkholderia ubonensis]